MDVVISGWIVGDVMRWVLAGLRCFPFWGVYFVGCLLWICLLWGWLFGGYVLFLDLSVGWWFNF